MRARNNADLRPAYSAFAVFIATIVVLSVHLRATQPDPLTAVYAAALPVQTKLANLQAEFNPAQIATHGGAEARALNGIASCYRSQGQNDKALGLFSRL